MIREIQYAIACFSGVHPLTVDAVHSIQHTAGHIRRRQCMLPLTLTLTLTLTLQVTFLDGNLYVVTGYCAGDFVLTASQGADGKWKWGSDLKKSAWGGKGDGAGTVLGLWQEDANHELCHTTLIGRKAQCSVLNQSIALEDGNGSNDVV